jgi:short-subunit dehydrogenase
MDGGILSRSISVAFTTTSSARVSYALFFFLVPHAYHLSPSFAVPELVKTKGQIVLAASGAAQVRVPNASEYCLSKHAVLRLAEFIILGESISHSHQIVSFSSAL